MVACSVEPSRTTANDASGRACARASGELAQLSHSFTILSEEMMQAEKRREMTVAQWKGDGAELMGAGTPVVDRGATTFKSAGRAAALGGERGRALRSAGARSAPRRAGAMVNSCQVKLRITLQDDQH